MYKRQVGGSIDAIFYCPSYDDNHEDRKPNAGMLIEIQKRFSISLKGIPAIGDSLRDLQAYEKVNAQPILVKTGNGESTLREKKYPKNTLIFDNLFEASNKIIEGL